MALLNKHRVLHSALLLVLLLLHDGRRRRGRACGTSSHPGCKTRRRASARGRAGRRVGARGAAPPRLGLRARPKLVDCAWAEGPRGRGNRRVSSRPTGVCASSRNAPKPFVGSWSASFPSLFEEEEEDPNRGRLAVRRRASPEFGSWVTRTAWAAGARLKVYPMKVGSLCEGMRLAAAECGAGEARDCSATGGRGWTTHPAPAPVA